MIGFFFFVVICCFISDSVLKCCKFVVGWYSWRLNWFVLGYWILCWCNGCWVSCGFRLLVWFCLLLYRWVRCWFCWFGVCRVVWWWVWECLDWVGLGWWRWEVFLLFVFWICSGSCCVGLCVCCWLGDVCILLWMWLRLVECWWGWCLKDYLWLRGGNCCILDWGRLLIGWVWVLVLVWLCFWIWCWRLIVCLCCVVWSWGWWISWIGSFWLIGGILWDWLLLVFNCFLIWFYRLLSFLVWWSGCW